jgi:hypothetical protein
MKDQVAYLVVILRISPLDKLGRFEPTAEFFLYTLLQSKALRSVNNFR